MVLAAFRGVDNGAGARVWDLWETNAEHLADDKCLRRFNFKMPFDVLFVGLALSIFLFNLC